MLSSRVKRSIGLLFVCVLVVSIPFSFAEKPDESEAKELTHLFGNHECPVSGDPVDPTTFAVYEDADNQVYGRIYTCCGGCTKKAEEKGAELYQKLYRTDAESGDEIEAIDLKNEKCPISGHGVVEAGMIEYNGMIVGHCCENCPTKFLEDPDTQLMKLVDAELKEKFEIKE